MARFLALLLLASSTDAGELSRFREVRPAMGSTFEITLYAADAEAAAAGFQAAFARVDDYNRVFSDYDAESEASRLSKSSGAGRAEALSDAMRDVLGWSLELSEQSRGAFDVTVGPLTRLWRRARRQHQLPDRQRLEQALAAVGYRHVVLDQQAETATLAVPGMRLDFGGVAKGAACDAALGVLRAAGIDRALVNGGGDLAIGDPPPGEAGWSVGVAPLQPHEPPRCVLELSRCGVATSGDAWQYVEIDGRRYSHLLDPRTGLGLVARSSVTVVARDGLTADGLASAVSVLGPAEGLRLVERYDGAACLVCLAANEGSRELTSARWSSLPRRSDGSFEEETSSPTGNPLQIPCVLTGPIR